MFVFVFYLHFVSFVRQHYTSLFTKMVASKEKVKCIQKYTINKNVSRIREMRSKQYAQQAVTIGLFIAMKTFKSLPLAEVRQIINHTIDLPFTE